MSLVQSILIDEDKLRAELKRFDSIFLHHMKEAVRETTRETEKDLEAATRSHVKGRLWRAWQSDVFPRTGLAREPVGIIRLNAAANKNGKRTRTYGAMEFFTQSGRITAGGGQYLAIPLPAAGSRGRARNLSPGEFEQRTGIRLRFVYRRGKPSLLVMDEAVISGRKGIARLNTEKRRATGRGNTTVPVFILIPKVDFANRFAIEPIIQRGLSALPDNFARRVRAVN